MENSDLILSFYSDLNAEVVFNAVNNPRLWWSEEIAGITDEKGSVFDYHYQDIHICQIQITEMIPNEKVVWYIKKNYFKFTQDTSEWTGTNITFDITKEGDKIKLTFTHHGLTPAYECYDICSDAWSTYIEKSLYNLITTGVGQPNGKDKPQTDNEKKLAAEKVDVKNYSESIIVSVSPRTAFEAIQQVEKWWTENLDGKTIGLGDEFTVYFGDVHVSTQKVISSETYTKIVWLVTKSKLNFVENQSEWTDTQIVFDIIPQNGKTEIIFTQIGLNADVECYGACSNAWSQYISGSLYKFITDGVGSPEKKDN
ncbi:MAG TPA: SRPBCC family protein [Saprospiraceae bacterium]|nr:SRPBCC family protein [Saprospiraceae bacterium]HPN68770.1 SRPBCC family protein [Saprospiraceae bacterium]